jgi:actin beta/gamma 1
MTAVVFDNGTYEFKAGIAGADLPTLHFPTLVNPQQNSVGHDAIASTNNYDALVRPFEHGVVTSSWDHLETIYSYSFNKLSVSSEEYAVLITEPPLALKSMREKMTQILFEVFNVPAMYIAISGVLGLYASGRTTGLVVDFGHQDTTVLPIYEGYALPHATIKNPIGGCDISDRLNRAIKTYTTINRSSSTCDTQAISDISFSGFDFNQNSYYDMLSSKMRSTALKPYTVDAVKEALCYVARQGTAYEEPTTGHFKLPDGNVLSFSEDRYTSTEVLFNPSLIGSTANGVHDSIFESIARIDIDIRASFWKNIIPVGGTSMLPGMKDRLQHELKSKCTDTLSIIESNERKYSNWIGGSILGSVNTFGTMWVTKYDYECSGPSVVHRKCF